MSRLWIDHLHANKAALEDFIADLNRCIELDGEACLHAESWEEVQRLQVESQFIEDLIAEFTLEDVEASAYDSWKAGKKG